MTSHSDQRPALSAANSDRLNQALMLSENLQEPADDAEKRLDELKMLLDSCRDGIHRQNPNHKRQRLELVNKARNYLHFLPDMQHSEAPGRLKSVTRRLKSAMRD